MLVFTLPLFSFFFTLGYDVVSKYTNWASSSSSHEWIRHQRGRGSLCEEWANVGVKGKKWSRCAQFTWDSRILHVGRLSSFNVAYDIQIRIWNVLPHEEITWWVMERSDYVQILRFIGIVAFCWRERRMSGVIVVDWGIEIRNIYSFKAGEASLASFGLTQFQRKFRFFLCHSHRHQKREMSARRVNGNLTQRMFPRDKWFTKKNEILKKKAHQDEKLNLISLVEREFYLWIWEKMTDFARA